MDCSLPGSSIHGIFQARVLEWVAISFSRGSSWPRDWIQVSCIVGRHFIAISQIPISTSNMNSMPLEVLSQHCSKWVGTVIHITAQKLDDLSPSQIVTYSRLDTKFVFLVLYIGPNGQAGLVRCGSWSHRELDTTEWLNWTELKIITKVSVNICSLIEKTD